MQVRSRTWFSVVVIAGLILLAGSRFALFAPLENAVLLVAAPIESTLQDGARPVADFVNNLTDINRLSRKNQTLREEIEQLRVENALLREEQTELLAYRQLLDIRDARTDDVFIAADVFAREPSNLRDVIAIDRGQADGLEEGMVVLTRQGSLVGSISRVLNDVAWVTLITDPTSAVSALIQESRTQGIVVGEAGGTLTMEFVGETADVKQGDLVLTSALGGGYPQGELIGLVVDVQRAAQELFQTVEVQPLAELSRLETVLVLASFVPREASAR